MRSREIPTTYGKIGRADAPFAGGTGHFAGGAARSESSLTAEDCDGLARLAAGAMSAIGAASMAEDPSTTDLPLGDGIGQ